MKVYIAAIAIALSGCGQTATDPQGKAKTMVVASVEDTTEAVVGYLAARALLQGVYPDITSPIPSAMSETLKPHVIAWLSLGNEPIEERLAVAASLFEISPPRLKQKESFDSYIEYVRSSVRLGGLTMKTDADLLREEGERGQTYAKNFLAGGDQSLSSDLIQQAIRSFADRMKGDTFNSERANLAAQTLAGVTKDPPKDVQDAHTELKQAIRHALSQNPDLAESLKQKMKLATEVRPSHEHVSKMVRAASGT